MRRHYQAIPLTKWNSFAYDGAPYTICFFLGKPEENGATCIGSLYNFSSSRRSQEGSCDNFQQQKASGTLARASLPITIPLLDRAQSPHFTDKNSLDPSVVTSQLRDFLVWRVVIGVSRNIEDLFFGGSIR